MLDFIDTDMPRIDSNFSASETSGAKTPPYKEMPADPRVVLAEKILEHMDDPKVSRCCGDVQLNTAVAIIAMHQLAVSVFWAFTIMPVPLSLIGAVVCVFVLRSFRDNTFREAPVISLMAITLLWAIWEGVVLSMVLNKNWFWNWWIKYLFLATLVLDIVVYLYEVSVLWNWRIHVESVFLERKVLDSGWECFSDSVVLLPPQAMADATQDARYNLKQNVERELRREAAVGYLCKFSLYKSAPMVAIHQFVVAFFWLRFFFLGIPALLAPFSFVAVFCQLHSFRAKTFKVAPMTTLGILDVLWMVWELGIAYVLYRLGKPLHMAASIALVIHTIFLLHEVVVIRKWLTSAREIYKENNEAVGCCNCI